MKEQKTKTREHPEIVYVSGNECGDFTYAQQHLKAFLNDRTAIRKSDIEDICDIPSGTLRHFLKGRRSLPEKYFDSLKEELHKYGYVALNSE